MDGDGNQEKAESPAENQVENALPLNPREIYAHARESRRERSEKLLEQIELRLEELDPKLKGLMLRIAQDTHFLTFPSQGKQEGAGTERAALDLLLFLASGPDSVEVKKEKPEPNAPRQRNPLQIKVIHKEGEKRRYFLVRSNQMITETDQASESLKEAGIRRNQVSAVTSFLKAKREGGSPRIALFNHQSGIIFSACASETDRKLKISHPPFNKQPCQLEPKFGNNSPSKVIQAIEEILTL